MSSEGCLAEIKQEIKREEIKQEKPLADEPVAEPAPSHYPPRSPLQTPEVTMESC